MNLIICGRWNSSVADDIHPREMIWELYFLICDMLTVSLMIFFKNSLAADDIFADHHHQSWIIILIGWLSVFFILKKKVEIFGAQFRNRFLTIKSSWSHFAKMRLFLQYLFYFIAYLALCSLMSLNFKRFNFVEWLIIFLLTTCMFVSCLKFFFLILDYDYIYTLHFDSLNCS
jgi:hypothetical protein